MSAIIPPHTCVNLSYLPRAARLSNSKKQFRGIPRCHTLSGVWLAGQKHESPLGAADDGDSGPIRIGDEGEEGGITVMRRSLAPGGLGPIRTDLTPRVFSSQLNG